MAKATLASIQELINSNHAEVTARLEKVEDQVKLTNGRVKDLERIKIGEEAVAKYKASRKADKRWDTTTIILFLTAIGTLIAALWWTRP